jgi:hypothetical protein
MLRSMTVLTILAAFTQLFMGATTRAESIDWNGGFTSNVSAGYYDQFIVRPVKEPSGNYTWYNFVTNWDQETIEVLPDGKPIIAVVNLYLEKEGKYYLSYEEYKLSERGPGGWRGADLYKKKITGTWSVIGDVLNLSNLGIGKPAIYQSASSNSKPQNAIEFQFQTVLNNQNLMNRKIILSGAYSHYPYQ